jgi:16S rRNA (uracil1498-N3)-methyltransferase
MRINSLVDATELAKEVVALPPQESHHLSRVLRVRPGQEIILFDGQGGVADAVVESVTKGAVEVRIRDRRNVPPPAVQIDLIQAVPKPDRWEWVLQKAVELGASNIRPVLSEHTEFKAGSKKEERWRKIILNAAQQCEVRWLPKLHSLEPMERLLPSLSRYDLALVGSLYDGAKPFRDVPLEGSERIGLIIGPEGDFTQQEVNALMNAGARAVSFGDRVLRTETAAVFGLSALAYKLL